MVEPAVRTEIDRLLGPGGLVSALDASETGLLVLPEDAAQLAAILKLASGARLPVYPTGRADPPIPARGIALSTSRLNRIVELDAANLTAIVEPGVNLAAFQREVEQQGLYYPPDPTNADTTLGATVAVNAAGPRSAKYGSTKDYVLGLQVALADGSLVNTGAKTVKNASGYNLTHLMVGSEGTLGVITRVSVRLMPLPEARQTLVASFASLGEASAAAAAVRAARLVPAAMAMLEPSATPEATRLGKLGVAPAPTILLLELDGSAVGVAQQVELVRTILRARGAEPAVLGQEQQQVIWDAHRQSLARSSSTANGAGSPAVLDRPLDPVALAVMRHFKQAFDGAGILNPGVLLPEQRLRGQLDGQ